MKIIKEHLLDHKSVVIQTAYFVKNSEIVATRMTSVGLMLYSISDVNETAQELRSFKICTAAETLFTDNVKYIGNFECEYGLMHIVEVL